MQENLVIVESPAKAKTIEKFLGKDYIVKSSFGHIRDLSKKDLGINIDDEFRPVYEIPGDKKKVVDELTKLAKSKTVWLASDEDREGEAIAWHLTEVLGLPVDQTKRIVFHEITKRAILEAIENPRTVNMDLVNAQQARRILDRLVGFELSPVLWKKVRPSLSAGRVQSVAVRLIVEREREIIAFRSAAYFRVVAQFYAAGDPEKAARYRGRPLTDLLGEPLLLREEGSGTRVILEYYLKEHGLAAAAFARTVEIGNIGAIKTLLKSGYGVSFFYRAAIRPEEAAGALGVIELSDFELRHDIMFLFPKNSNFRADYTTIFRELRACAEETGGA